MPETPETVTADEFADLPPLARSMTDQLTELCAHAYRHGQHDEQTGEEPGENMPECLADHVGGLSAALFGLARPEEADSVITGVVEVPIDLPDGLIKDLQKAVGEELAKIGKQS